jgi:hypothetical protein
MAMKLKSCNLQQLASLAAVIKLKIANSDVAWEEQGGNENYEIQINTSTNEVSKVKPNSKESKLYQYTGSKAVGIPEAYVDWQSFEGMFDVRSAEDDKKWYVSYHGSSVEDSSDDLSEEDIELVSEVLSPKVVFAIIEEVLSEVE